MKQYLLGLPVMHFFSSSLPIKKLPILHYCPPLVIRELEGLYLIASLKHSCTSRVLGGGCVDLDGPGGPPAPSGGSRAFLQGCLHSSSSCLGWVERGVGGLGEASF